MLSLNALERASQAYRRGYLMGSLGEPFNDITEAAPGTFAARDYAEGYKAGQIDARPIQCRCSVAPVTGGEQERIATDRGAADFFAGKHMNPYSWSQTPKQFRAWIVGYNAAKAIGGTQ